ncbi:MULTISPECIES: DUF6090 family protein [Altibacter]|uniref:DUF6090 family protein n=1 Tax=Altibacter TaxID=1535231 RepID=UPI00054DBE72|nr:MULTISPECIES: DUF6090 family protein [Altibacter]MCW9037941.1 DUF6090 family protein [Altibacter sp.]
MRGTKKIDWLNHFLEFIVVIVGILIAFQLNTCSEEKKEQLLIDRHVENVVQEARFNRENIEQTIKASERLSENIDSLIALIGNKGDLRSINDLGLRVLSYNNAYYKKTAYNTMVTSGDIRFFENLELRDAIISLYEYYAWAEGIDKASLENYSNYYYPYVAEHFDLIAGSPQDISVYDNKSYLNILATYNYMMKNRIAKQKEILEKTNEFLESYTPRANPVN